MKEWIIRISIAIITTISVTTINQTIKFKKNEIPSTEQKITIKEYGSDDKITKKTKQKGFVNIYKKIKKGKK